MDAEPGLIESLRKAVSALPDDLGLRLHLASQLLAAGLRAEAVSQLGAVLQADPANAGALTMLADLGAQPAGDRPPVPDQPAEARRPETATGSCRPRPDAPARRRPGSRRTAAGPASPASTGPGPRPTSGTCCRPCS